MATESAAQITDLVEAQLVECAPEPEPVAVAIPVCPEESPAARIAEATIEQVGADPPPGVSHG